MLDGFDDYYAKWISPATTWMRANRAEELAKVESTSDGREAGAINAKLCKEYGESLKATPVAAAAAKVGKVEIKKGEITSEALAGNLLGDPATRNYYVLLPPNYAASDKRYPVVYVLHNFGESVSGPIESIKQAYEGSLQSGDAQEMIFVVSRRRQQAVGKPVSEFANHRRLPDLSHEGTGGDD